MSTMELTLPDGRKFEEQVNAATGAEAALPCDEGRYNRYLERKIKEEVSL